MSLPRKTLATKVPRGRRSWAVMPKAESSSCACRYSSRSCMPEGALWGKRGFRCAGVRRTRLAGLGSRPPTIQAHRKRLVMRASARSHCARIGTANSVNVHRSHFYIARFRQRRRRPKKEKGGPKGVAVEGKGRSPIREAQNRGAGGERMGSGGVWGGR
eukprot:scaffold5037_cov114-Isochrysis_galbana.AAC.21